MMEEKPNFSQRMRYRYLYQHRKRLGLFGPTVASAFMRFANQEISDVRIVSAFRYARRHGLPVRYYNWKWLV